MQDLPGYFPRFSDKKYPFSLRQPFFFQKITLQLPACAGKGFLLRFGIPSQAMPVCLFFHRISL
jgi:hypothetical protein